MQYIVASILIIAAPFAAMWLAGRIMRRLTGKIARPAKYDRSRATPPPLAAPVFVVTKEPRDSVTSAFGYDNGVMISREPEDPQ